MRFQARFVRALSPVLLQAGLLSCFSDAATVEVVLTPPEMAEIVALPYDEVGLLDEYAASVTPRPEFPQILMEISEYRLPRLDGIEQADAAWTALRDSLEDLSDRLFATDRTSDTYRSLYGLFSEMYSRYTTASRQRDRAIRRVLGRDRDLAERAQAAADTLRRWENSAFAAIGVPDDTDANNPEILTAATDARGRAQLRLTNGTWWIQARIRHQDNPFLEYFWNREIHVTGLQRRLRVPLSEETALIRWRH